MVFCNFCSKEYLRIAITLLCKGNFCATMDIYGKKANIAKKVFFFILWQHIWKARLIKLNADYYETKPCIRTKWREKIEKILYDKETLGEIRTEWKSQYVAHESRKVFILNENIFISLWRKERARVRAKVLIFSQFYYIFHSLSHNFTTFLILSDLVSALALKLLPDEECFLLNVFRIMA